MVYLLKTVKLIRVLEVLAVTQEVFNASTKLSQVLKETTDRTKEIADVLKEIDNNMETNDEENVPV